MHTSSWLSKGYPFGEARQKSYKDPALKERNFTTPLALHAKRPAPPPPDSPWPRPRELKARMAKATGGSKVQLAPPRVKPFVFATTASRAAPNKKNCRFKHVCQLCFAKHRPYQCKVGGRPVATPNSGTGGKGGGGKLAAN